MWTRFFDTAFEDGHWHLQLQISPHLPLTIILRREVMFGGFILVIIAPPTAVTLMIGMLSDASRRGANRQWSWLHGQYTRLPRHPYGAIDVYDWLLLCGGVVSLSVFIYEVGSMMSNVPIWCMLCSRHYTTKTTEIQPLPTSKTDSAQNSRSGGMWVSVLLSIYGW